MNNETGRGRSGGPEKRNGRTGSQAARNGKPGQYRSKINVPGSSNEKNGRAGCPGTKGRKLSKDISNENLIGLGEYKELRIARKKEFGLYLINDLTKQEVLLPAKETPENAAVGDRIMVFLYLDSEDRPIATTSKPKLSMGKIAVLTVKQITKIGAFLDWGLPKDLFLPYKEMTERVEEGDEVLVRLYLDHSSRLCASMKKLYPLMDNNSPYVPGDTVSGRIYEFGHDFGTFVAVDDHYSAMIPKHEDVSGYQIGDIVSAKVAFVKEDGKLDITLREKAYLQMDADSEKVVSVLRSYGGVLPFTEAATPEVIKRETGLSKAAFKRAVGHLYKERVVTIDNGKIRLKEEKEK